MEKRNELTTDMEWIARLEGEVSRLRSIIRNAHAELEPATNTVNPSLLRVRSVLSVLERGKN